MRSRAKLLSLILAGTILSTFCVSCSSDGSSNSSSQSSNSSSGSSQAAEVSSAEPQEPVTISIMNRLNADYKLTDNPVLEKIEELANVKLEIDAPPIGNYEERQQIAMASQDLPDIVYIWNLTANYEKWSEEGLIIPLDEYIPMLTNAEGQITETMWEFCRVPQTGSIHAIPRPNVLNRYGLNIRADWLEAVGMDIPQTLDEFFEVAKAFAQNDPDGNGENDTYGFSFAGTPASCTNGVAGCPAVMSAFNLPATLYNKVAQDEDGVYKAREALDGYFPYLEFLKKCFDEGVLDPEFFTDKIYGDGEKFGQNRIGMVLAKPQEWYDSAVKMGLEPEDIQYVLPFPDDNGVRHYYEEPAVWGGWCISEQCENIEAVINFINWGLSEEGIALTTFGIQGDHYESYDEENRLLVQTPEQLEAQQNLVVSYMTFTTTIGGAPITMTPGSGEGSMANINNFNEEVVSTPVNTIRSAAMSDFEATYPDLLQKRDTMEVGVIIGNYSMDEYKEFLESDFLPKIQPAVDEINELAAK